MERDWKIYIEIHRQTEYSEKNRTDVRGERQRKAKRKRDREDSKVR